MTPLCNFKIARYLKLIYRASRDGFKSSDFHAKCDTSLETITVIKSDNGCIFGGYTQKSWQPSERVPFTKADSNAFIFSLINNTKATVKIQCNPRSEAIICRKNMGPCFGLEDISICCESNLNNKSFSNVLTGYSCVRAVKSNNLESVVLTPDFLTGSKYFKTLEIETFEVEKSKYAREFES